MKWPCNKEWDVCVKLLQYICSIFECSHSHPSYHAISHPQQSFGSQESNVWTQFCVLRCQALTKMLLETEIFWDVTLCGWVSNCWCSKIIVPSSGRSSNPRKTLKMDCLTTLKMKALSSFTTSGNTHPATVSHPWSLRFLVLCSRGTHN